MTGHSHRPRLGRHPDRMRTSWLRQRAVTWLADLGRPPDTGTARPGRRWQPRPRRRYRHHRSDSRASGRGRPADRLPGRRRHATHPGRTWGHDLHPVGRCPDSELILRPRSRIRRMPGPAAHRLCTVDQLDGLWVVVPPLARRVEARARLTAIRFTLGVQPWRLVHSGHARRSVRAWSRVPIGQECTLRVHRVHCWWVGVHRVSS